MLIGLSNSKQSVNNRREMNNDNSMFTNTISSLKFNNLMIDFEC